MKVYHRRYPDTKRDYKGVSEVVNGIEVIYYTLSNHGKKSRGVEVYKGRNYNPDSKDKSWSRRYSMHSIPSTLKKIVSMLVKEHRKIKWSNEKEVNLN